MERSWASSNDGAIQARDEQLGAGSRTRGTSTSGDLVVIQREHVPLLLGQLAVGDHQPEQDLEVDLAVGEVHAARVVERVGVEAAALQRVFDPSELGDPRFPPSPTTSQRSSSALTRTASLARSRVAIDLAGRLHVRADPAVPERSTGALSTARISDSPSIGAVSAGSPKACLASALSGTSLDPRATRRPARAARVVVVPRRLRQPEEALALAERGLGDGRGVQEHVAVVERGDQTDVPGEQHPVAEHVAATCRRSRRP